MAWYDFEAGSSQLSVMSSVTGAYSLGSVPKTSGAKYTGLTSAYSNNRDLFPAAKLSPYMPINFGTANWTISMWFNMVALECCAQTPILSIGPLWVGQVGYIGSMLTIAFSDVTTLAHNTYAAFPKTVNGGGLNSPGVWRNLAIPHVLAITSSHYRHM